MEPGEKIAHYEILAHLGEGGMGVVLKARDTKLDRLVALKVLPRDRLVDDQDRRRFVQEAKAASALNQPNIIVIYEINEWEGGQYIAMEYVQGKNLHDLTRERGLTLLETLHYSVQIATALAAAHEAGITHRDLKPANIMVSEKGVVKVLDFGLAKLNRGPELTDASPTMSLRADEAPYTAKGTVVGTFAYMSPEQATGKLVDPRSDIFSFGAVLYEMVTGKRAFRGKSTVSTLTAILHLEPEAPSVAVPGVPREVERIINRCLKKDREQRFQSMTDVRLALLDLEEETAAGKLVRATDIASLASRPETLKSLSRAEAEALISQISTAAAIEPPIPRRKVVLGGVIALACLAAAGLAAWRLGLLGGDSAPPPPQVRVTSDPGLSTDPALSPDGRLVVYASDRTGQGNLSLWMRNLSGGEPVQLTSGLHDDYQPSFSPDGAYIAFRSDRDGGGIYVIPALGGVEPRPVAPHGRNPRYSPDGKQIVYWVGELQAAAQIYVAPAGGGGGRALNFQPALQARMPVWSPDGKYLLFLGREARAGGLLDWWVAAPSGGKAESTGVFDAITKAGLRTSYSTAPRDWTADGVYFPAGFDVRGGRDRVGANIVNPNDAVNVWRIPMSGARKAAGSPERLTFGTGLDSAFSVAPTRDMVFASLAESVNVWSLPVRAAEGKASGQLVRLTSGTAVDAYPSVTSDGKKMVFWSDRSGNADIWLMELDTGNAIRLTVDKAFETFPIISPDGASVAWAVLDDPKFPSINFMKLGPGSRPGPVEKVCSSCGNLSDLSNDGRVLYYNDPTSSIVLRNIATGETSRIAKRETTQTLADPRFSPDGRWVAYHAIVGTLARQVQIAPAPDIVPDGERIAITAGQSMDRLAAWSTDGDLLYFVSEADGFRCIAARKLDRATRKPAGPIFFVHHSHSPRRSMMNFVNVNMARLGIARDRILFSLAERTGNLWMTTLR